MNRQALYFACLFAASLAAKALMIFAGFFAVGVGVFFCAPDASAPLRPFSQYPGSWQRVRLPWWLRPWDNPFDGLWGDTRGDWAQWCQGVGLDYRSRFAMWLWAAIRNPANHFSRYALGVDVADGHVERLAGAEVIHEEPGARAWQFLKFSPASGLPRYRFFLVWALPLIPSKAVLVDLGWKIKTSHNAVLPDAPENDRRKGFVFVLSPWKTIA